MPGQLNFGACISKYPRDDPAESDAFGSYTRVVALLESVVRTQDGGRIIGIEGAWGSGKSTLVNLLKTRSLSRPGLLLITFDAWQHEGDPLRRAFLESLVLELRSAEWIDERAARRFLRELRTNKKSVRTKEIPRVTPGTWLFALSLLLVPVGIVLLQTTLDEIYLWPPRLDQMSGRAVLGVLLAIGPALIGIAMWSLRKWRGSAWRTGSPWQLALTRTLNEQSSIRTESLEPSTIEFHDLFQRIMAVALAEPERRLAIAVDNLDRMPSSDALRMWGSIRGFLEASQFTVPMWNRRLWVLVPFVKESLSLHLAKAGSGQGTLDSYLKKTCQIVVRCPELVFSDWRGYVRKQLAEALPKHAAEDVRLAFEVYQHHVRRVHGLSPLPRDIKRFVNDLCTYHDMWGHSFPLGDLAYFVLQGLDGDRKGDFQRALLNGQAVEETYGRWLSSSINDSLAALHFGVEVSHARQLLLRDPLISAISEGEAGTVDTLSTLGEGFWAIFETIAFDELVVSRFDTPSIAAMILTFLDERHGARCFRQPDREGVVTEALSKLVSGVLEKKDLFGSLPEDSAVWQKSADMLTLLYRKRSSAHLRSHLVKSIEAAPVTHTNASGWRYAICALLQAIRECEGNTSLPESIVIGGIPQGFMILLRELIEHDEKNLVSPRLVFPKQWETFLLPKIKQLENSEPFASKLKARLEQVVREIRFL